MALVSWKAAASGDWSTPTDWSTGTVPTAADDAEITLVGNYTVSVSLAETARTLDFNAPGAQLVESSTGKLTLSALSVENGYVELDAANTVGSSFLSGGEMALGKAGALGSGELTFANGELLATVNQTLTNQLNLQCRGRHDRRCAWHGAYTE